MKFIEKIKNSLQGLIDAFSRYPLTAIFLFIAAGLNAVSINAEKNDFEKQLVALIVGAFLSTVVQMIYERFYSKINIRIILNLIAAAITIGYYMILRNVPELSMEIGIKTAVAVFGLFIAFLWAPSIKNKSSFNETFMSGFKAFFIAVFFSGIIFGGLSLIYGATDQLLFSINSKLYMHTANIVFVLFTPMYFLSLTPRYVGKNENDYTEDELKEVEKEIGKAVACPKYLEILISYIIIPLTAVFTLILLIYIIANIRGSFWTNTLLEPMLVAYIIEVILLYILASNLDNKFVLLFRKIFPKVLVPIVLFQTINSILKISDVGLTFGRYYVIMFGIFAFISGIIFSALPIRKNGLIAGILIALIAISIIPPVDAFSISRASQINKLESILTENNMLVNNTIKPNSSITDIDMEKIVRIATYLDMLKYTNKINWLPVDFELYRDFEKTFGFALYDIPNPTGTSFYVRSSFEEFLDVSGYDYLVKLNIGNPPKGISDKKSIEFIKNGEKYFLNKILNDENYSLAVTDKNNTELINFDGRQIFDKFVNYNRNDKELPLNEVTFTEENDKIKITVIVQYMDMSKDGNNIYYSSEIYVLVKIK